MPTTVICKESNPGLPRERFFMWEKKRRGNDAHDGGPSPLPRHAKKNSLQTHLTVNPKKLETGLRPNSAGIPYTILLRIEAMGFPTFGLLL